MNPARYSYVAQEASTRYLTVLQALRSLLNSGAIRPFSTTTAQDLREQAYTIANTYFKTETLVIRQDLHQTALEALRTAYRDLEVGGALIDLPDDLEAFLDQAAEHLEREIYSQLVRDVEAIVARYRTLAIEAKLANTDAKLEIETLHFNFRDRAGRAQASHKFVRTVYRLSNVTLGAEFYALTATTLGANHLYIVTTDPQSNWSEYEIDLTDPVDFTEIRDEVFHPNSDSVLEATF